jgi:serine phosphatase RsbU (regulator of sigma subunit)
MTKDCSKILKEQAIDFEIGDIFILYTDGITEAHNGPYPTSELWGIERLIESIKYAPTKSAQ